MIRPRSLIPGCHKLKSCFVEKIHDLSSTFTDQTDKIASIISLFSVSKSIKVRFFRAHCKAIIALKILVSPLELFYELMYTLLNI